MLRSKSPRLSIVQIILISTGAAYTRCFSIVLLTLRDRAMVMVLEDRGVKKDSFMTLQDKAVANARTMSESLSQFRMILKDQHLGTTYRLNFIIDRLIELVGEKTDNAFLNQIRHFALTHVLRDIKHRARIPIPGGWLLVGVADEGPAYVDKGYENVYTLKEGQIFGSSFSAFYSIALSNVTVFQACVQGPDDPEPIWLRGACTLSRSPVVHPGDSEWSLKCIGGVGSYFS
jgi:RNA-dependent RNA polymerase